MRMDRVTSFAQAARPEFRVTEANVRTVSAICQRLDGLPLAIELAAARVRLLPPQALLERLSSRLELLSGGRARLPARQQTLRATIDWSHALLDPEERRLFRRLAVFVGGCTLEAVTAVLSFESSVLSSEGGNSELEVLDGPAALIDKSLLLQREGADGEPRFTMLETIREYALEQLAASGELEELQCLKQDILRTRFDGRTLYTCSCHGCDLS
jgi:predicted ATPase